jgi:hypothetical protein
VKAAIEIKKVPQVEEIKIEEVKIETLPSPIAA